MSLWAGVAAQGDGSSGVAVPRLLAALKAAGLPAAAPVFLGAHSPAVGADALDFVLSGNETVAGVALVCGFVPRDRRGPAGASFHVPVLTVAASLDGLARVTRVGAEAYAAQDAGGAGAASFPVTVVRGASHASFFTGSPPPAVAAADLVPTASSAAAQTAAADAMASFVQAHHSGVAAEAQATHRRALFDAVQTAGTFLQPLLDAMQMSGNRRLHPACDADFPTNPTCQYPSWPAKSLPPGPKPAPSPLPPSDCACGSPFVADTAQAVMAGLSLSPLPGTTLHTKDAFFDVTDVRPFHLPHIFESCTSLPCALNSTTVTEPVYLDDGTPDDGVAPLSALELKSKLKSREAMWDAVGADIKHTNITDGSLHLCQAINNASWHWALQHAAADVRARFLAVGEHFVPTPDVIAGIGITGPKWVAQEMTYTRVPAQPQPGSAAKTAVDVQSVAFVVANLNQGSTPWVSVVVVVVGAV